jgi:hypothetical protein
MIVLYFSKKNRILFKLNIRFSPNIVNFSEFNLSKPNTCLFRTKVFVRKGFGLDRFHCIKVSSLVHHVLLLRYVHWLNSLKYTILGLNLMFSLHRISFYSGFGLFRVRFVQDFGLFRTFNPDWLTSAQTFSMSTPDTKQSLPPSTQQLFDGHLSRTSSLLLDSEIKKYITCEFVHYSLSYM